MFPDQRRDRRDRRPEFEQLPPEGYQGHVEPLPRGYHAGDADSLGRPKTTPFLKTSRTWYARVGRSPEADKWTSAQWEYLRLVIAPNFDQIQRGRHERMGELRLQLVELGLTLMARQRARMQIAVRPGGVAADAPPKPQTGSAGRRARLTAVNGGIA